MSSIIRATTTSGLQVAPDNSGSLQLQTNGTTTAVTIDTSQNVGIGTSSPTNKLTVNGGIELTGSSFSGSGTGIWQQATNVLGFVTAGSTRAAIDATGNVGIGTTSPSYKLQVLDTSATGGISLRDATYIHLFRNRGNTLDIIADTGNTGGDMRFFANGITERMRITSGGEVYIAGTTDQGAYNLQCNGTGVWGAGAYVNGSDERIKQDITPIDTGLDVVNKLNPVTYKYKEDWSKDQSIQTGFIAQDLLVALEGKNYVDGIVQQGGEYMSVAYQNIIPILTKAIQEQQTIINDLKARIETLESK